MDNTLILPPPPCCVTRGASVDPVDICPNYGDNCYKRYPSLHSYSAAMDAFISFKSYYDAANLNSFFADSSNWKTLFPGLNINSDTITNIKNGTYYVYVTKDSNIIVFSGRSDSAKALLGIVPNLNVPQIDD